MRPVLRFALPILSIASLLGPAMTVAQAGSPGHAVDMRQRHYRLLGPEPAAIAAIGPTDVWEVGRMPENRQRHVSRTFIAHWDGVSWTRFPSPNPGSLWNGLSQIDAVSSDDVWAVGEYLDVAQRPYESLVLHWDGVSWNRTPFPAGTTSHDVSGVSPTDAWIVGYSSGSGQTVHWNGHDWQTIRNPPFESPALKPALLSVSALSSDEVWAGGYTYPPGQSHDDPMTEHWNGSRWKIVPVAESDSSNGWVKSIYAADSDDVWAVGRSYFAPHEYLFEHWDGMQWSAVDAPMRGEAVELPSVDGTSATDVWVVGAGISRAPLLIEHWDGTAWTDASILGRPDARGGYLVSVSADAPDDAWAIGFEDDPDPRGGLRPVQVVSHWDGVSWTTQ